MDEVDSILIYTLKQIGCDVGSKVGDLTPPQIIKCVSRCFELIRPDFQIPAYDGNTSMSARYKVASQISQAITDLGYSEEIGCQSFLYPTENDTRKLLIFMMEKLPKGIDSEVGNNIETLLSKITKNEDENINNNELYVSNGVEVGGIRLPAAIDVDSLPKETLRFYASHLAELTFAKQRAKFTKTESPVVQPPPLSSPKFPSLDDGDDVWDTDDPLPTEVEIVEKPRVKEKPKITEKPKIVKSKPPIKEKPKLTSRSSESETIVEDEIRKRMEDEERTRMEDEERIRMEDEERSRMEDKKRKRMEDEERSRMEAEERKQMEDEKRKQMEEEILDAEAARQIKSIQEDAKAKAIQLHFKESSLKSINQTLLSMNDKIRKLKDEYEKREREIDRKRKTAELFSDSEDGLEKVKRAIETQVEKIFNLGQQWEKHREPLIKEIRNKYDAANLSESDTVKQRMEIRNLKTNLKEMGQEAKSKEAAYANLLEEYEKMPKDLNRSAYTKRIIEIIANIKKQRKEITKVLNDTKEIQKDINTLSGKLGRTFAVADELIFQDAEKDKSVAQSYKLLVAIHSDFSRIIKVLEDIGNIKRLHRDLEDKLDLEKSKNVEGKLERLLADMAQMKHENQVLQAKLRDPAFQKRPIMSTLGIDAET